ncbi:hypothetical protein EON83_30490 [bacterium]|nr:MAG: hypothetical protein EON83_30490 [bacterium]
MKLAFTKIFLATILLSGCAANQAWINATPEQRKIMFENWWNGAVGKPFEVYPPIVLRSADLKDGRHEYIIKQHVACQLALVVEDNTKILLSWRYISDQAKCAAYYYATGA